MLLAGGVTATDCALGAGLAALMVAAAGACDAPTAAAYVFLSAPGGGVMRAACKGPTTWAGCPSAG